MRAVAFIIIMYVLFDIQRRIKDKDKFLTQKDFAAYKTTQADTNAEVAKRLDALESSAFS